MMQRFGDRATFAVEVGEHTSPRLRTVDLWAAGKWLTADDNAAYVPSFSWSLRCAADEVYRRVVPPRPFPGSSPDEIFGRLEADDESDFRQQFWLLHWGETLDNVSSYTYLDDDLVILFQFRRPTHPFPEELGQTFEARIPPDDFVTTLEGAADLLDREFPPPPPATPDSGG